MFKGEAFQQFIFAGQEDTYYLPGALGLKLEPYLWYQLCKQKKKAYFIRQEADGSKKVKTFRPDTGRWVSFIPEKRKFLQRLPPEDALCAKIEELLKGNEQNAVIIPAGMFCDLYANYPERFRRLQSISPQERRGNALMILCTVPASSRISLFSGGQADASGGPIPREQRLYHLLRERMPHQVHTLNEPEQQELYALLRRISLEKDFARYGPQTLDDMAWYLWVWLGSSRLRTDAGIVCPDRIGSTRLWLDRILREREHFEAFRQAAREWRRRHNSLGDLAAVYAPETPTDKTDLSEIALDCTQKALSMELGPESAENFRRSYKLWELYRTAQEQTENPVLQSTLEATRELLRQANALLNDSPEEFERKIKWLRYRLDHNGQFDPEEEEVRKEQAVKNFKFDPNGLWDNRPPSI